MAIYILGLFLIISPIVSIGQILTFKDIPIEILQKIDQMGVDTLSTLSIYEGKYLNEIFKENLNGFDFIGKKVGFLHRGNVSNKSEYFGELKERFCRKDTPIGGSALYVFDSVQKSESGGYDAAVVYWSKVLIPNEKLVKKLKSGTSH
ncbi:hypothetical protein [Mariniradius sediminis]|uniref:DUF8192 domain-containing protein n=1 Tax=Mariniradius sediminis TaxID=2909237 RepID=A0ABS9BTI2_9BACT|nr:hypothetical protein [Mariniradius sediminis]MCF1750777.1 hypothetical protein [Mariniradius sediminis]